MNSSQLRGYLTGLILGDAHIDNGVVKRALRLKSINLDFIQQVYSDLDITTNFKMFIKDVAGYTDKYGTNHKDYQELYIKAHPYFSKIYHHFYDDYRGRVISKWAKTYLNVQGLANWFMSDGYTTLVGRTSGKITHRRVELCTDRYGEDGAYAVSEYFNSCGYRTRSFKRGKVFRVRFYLDSAQDFLCDISEYVVPSMKYKLYLAYDYRPTWMSDDYFKLMNDIKNSAYPRIFAGEEIVH